MDKSESPLRATAALGVRCPTCLSRPGKPCKSISAWYIGQPCMPHRARRLSAAKKITGTKEGS